MENIYKEYKDEYNGLHVIYCANCDNQIDCLDFGGYDYCKKCDKPCTGLSNSYETGYEIRTVHGYCKKCNTKIEYEG